MLLSYDAGISPQLDAGTIIGGVAGKNALSEFAQKLIQLILKSIYDPMYESVNKIAAFH